MDLDSFDDQAENRELSVISVDSGGVGADWTTWSGDYRVDDGQEDKDDEDDEDEGWQDLDETGNSKWDGMNYRSDSDDQDDDDDDEGADADLRRLKLDREGSTSSF
jgi:hypothetical protein